VTLIEHILRGGTSGRFLATNSSPSMAGRCRNRNCTTP